MSNIKAPLSKLFKKHRIVFWYDAERELRADFEALELPDVHKIELDNNEFKVKYRILREEPEACFLLYHEGPQPADLDNWLLDVLLTCGEFRTDQASIYLGELGLGPITPHYIKYLPKNPLVGGSVPGSLPGAQWKSHQTPLTLCN